MEQQKKTYYNCSVDGCFNSTINSELSFFSLPVDSERKTEWLRLMHREDLKDKTCLRARVCEAHFCPNSIILRSNRKMLKRNSVPQLLLPLPIHNFADKETQTVIETAHKILQKAQFNCLRL
ncbi:hypothetical protein B5X24_HaOG208474 [Helicoverpa armigera]|uniref:THAP-type domain-containing protein n=1 Tax=Helicoverpa armigera TaxID=29058 RepID=A0A2W1BJV9_HELAM|nr:hypothetical protein B5X24_HaOG208474 [Helicoverpa armigera]